MPISRSFFLFFGLMLVSWIVLATPIGDEICATATRHGSVADTVILNNVCATVSATDVEFSAPNFQGAGSLFTMDFSEASFSIFVDLADFSFMEPWTIMITSLDWVDMPGQIDSVTQTVFEGTWLNNIVFGADFITLTSGPNTFIGGVTFAVAFDFVASHDDIPNQVPEPGTVALFGLALVAMSLTRRRKQT